MLLTFESARKVVVAEERLRGASIKVVAVPMAKNITARCGIGLDIDSNDWLRVQELLKDIEFEIDEKI